MTIYFSLVFYEVMKSNIEAPQHKRVSLPVDVKRTLYKRKNELL